MSKAVKYLEESGNDSREWRLVPLRTREPDQSQCVLYPQVVGQASAQVV